MLTPALVLHPSPGELEVHLLHGEAVTFFVPPLLWMGETEKKLQKQQQKKMQTAVQHSRQLEPSWEERDF